MSQTCDMGQLVVGTGYPESAVSLNCTSPVSGRIEPGGSVSTRVVASVTEDGWVDTGSVTIGLYANGNKKAQKTTLDIEPGGSGAVNFEVSFDSGGTYNLTAEIESANREETSF